MVSIYGLNKRVGNISFYDSRGRDSFTKPYSEETAKVIDEEVSKLVEEQYQRALQILEENKDKLIQLAEKLLASEVLFKEDLVEIFGKRPWDKDEEVLIEEKTADVIEISEDNTLDLPAEKVETLGTEDKTETEEAPEDTKSTSDNSEG
jgi:cell division protease FtsH